MKNSNILLATALSVNCLLGYARQEPTREVKLTEIQREDVEGGIARLVKNGILKLVDDKPVGSRHRALKKNEGGAKKATTSGNQNVRVGGTHTQQNKKTTGRAEPNFDSEEEYAVADQDDTSYFDDYFKYDDHYYQDDVYEDVDDYYYGKGKGKGGKKDSKKSKKGKGGKGGKKSKKCGKGYNCGGAVAEQTYAFTSFLDVSNAEVVYADPESPDEMTIGNRYILQDLAVYDPEFIQASAMLGIVQGTCTRTEGNFDSPRDGTGVCSFTVEMLEHDTVVASFTATGSLLQDDNIDSELTITGGLGDLTGVTGKVIVKTASLDYAEVPPKMYLDSDLDVLFAVGGDGYEMYAELTVLTDPGFEDWVPIEDDSGICYSSPGVVVEGCSCYESCHTCGYNHNPSNDNDCIDCPPGFSIMPFYSDGTGYCILDTTSPTDVGETVESTSPTSTPGATETEEATSEAEATASPTVSQAPSVSQAPTAAPL